jgi:iron complex outermembrane receptor protein
MQSRHCPRNGKCCSQHESDTSLTPGAFAPFVHDVAEGNIGGNLRVVGCAHAAFSAFPPSSHLGLRNHMSSKLTTQSRGFLLSGLSAAIISIIAPVTFAAPKKLETVYVSATRSETAQMPVATQIKVITEEDIRVSGAKLLSEVLRTQAGIQLTDSDGSGARNVTASMRGLSGANNVLVLVDGRKLNNPSLAAPALNTVSLKDVERIEIVQGSAGVLYGDQAVGGVINIITRRASAGETNGSVSATSGTDNLEDYTASVRQGFANGLSYSVSAQKRNADNYRDNNQSAYENLLGNLRYDFEKGFLFVEAQQVKDDLRLPGAISNNQAMIDPRVTYSPNDYSNQNTDLLRTGGGVDLSEVWQFLMEYADRDEDGIAFYDDYTSSNGYFPWLSESSMRVKNITPRIVGNIKTASGLAIVTLGYDGVEADYTTKDGYTNIAQDIEGFYGQLVYPLTSKLNLSVGARHSSVRDEDIGKKKTHDDDLNAGDLGLNYQIDEQWRLFARYADGFRFANADENGAVLPGVEFLEVQTSQSFEAGGAWADEKASITYSVYHMTLNDEITFDSLAYANFNLPDSERQGFIFEGQLQLSNEIGLRANYTYTDAELSEGVNKGNSVPYISENTVNFAINFAPVDSLIVNLESTYLGSRYLNGDDANALKKVSSLQLFNLNVIWEFKQVELAGRINNLTNERYAGFQAVWGQYPQPERNYQASITYRF